MWVPAGRQDGAAPQPHAGSAEQLSDHAATLRLAAQLESLRNGRPALDDPITHRHTAPPGERGPHGPPGQNAQMAGRLRAAAEPAAAAREPPISSNNLATGLPGALGASARDTESHAAQDLLQMIAVLTAREHDRHARNLAAAAVGFSKCDLPTGRDQAMAHELSAAGGCSHNGAKPEAGDGGSARSESAAHRTAQHAIDEAVQWMQRSVERNRTLQPWLTGQHEAVLRILPSVQNTAMRRQGLLVLLQLAEQVMRERHERLL